MGVQRAFTARAALLVVLLLSTTLLSGCGLEQAVERWTAWLKAQPELASTDGASLDTSSISYALQRRATASAQLVEGASVEDIRRLAGRLETYVAKDSGLKEVRLHLTVDTDSVTLSGRRTDNDRLLTAYPTLRALPGVSKVELVQYWSPNGLTSDPQVKATVAMATSADVIAGLPVLTESVHTWQAGSALKVTTQDDGLTVTSKATVPVAPATATALTALAGVKGATLRIGQDSHDPSPVTEDAIVAEVDQAAVALALRNAAVNSSPTGLAPNLWFKGGPLWLGGGPASPGRDSAILLTVADAPCREIVWQDGRFIVAGLGNPCLETALASIPEQAPLEIQRDAAYGVVPEFTASGTTAETKGLYAQFGALAGTNGPIDRLTVTSTSIDMVLIPVGTVKSREAFTALRSVAWAGERRISVSGYVSQNLPVDVSFTSTSTGRATARDASKGMQGAQDPGKVKDASLTVIDRWDATATTP